MGYKGERAKQIILTFKNRLFHCFIFKYAWEQLNTGDYTDLKSYTDAMKAYNLINPIIERKKKGIDCTESESAEIKQFIKNDANYPDEIKDLFPIEYSEAISELFNEVPA